MSETIFNEYDLGEQAERSVKQYTASPQELAAPEQVEQVDKTPASEADVQDLAERLDGLPRGWDNQADGNDAGYRGSKPFVIPGNEGWVHPIVKQRRTMALMLPNIEQILDLEHRISDVMRMDGAPDEVAKAAQKARLMVGAARNAYDAARHPEKPKFAASQQAKDEVIKAIAAAVTHVAHLEEVAESSRQAWFDVLVSDVDKQRADALKALRAAAKAYAAFRGTVGSAQALALEAGMWDKEFHHGPIEDSELDKPIDAMRAAIGYLEGEDDAASGRFLTADYGDAVPPHTLARLKRSAEMSSAGSFAWQVYDRAKSGADHDAQVAIRSKALLTLLNANPLAVDLYDRHTSDDNGWDA